MDTGAVIQQTKMREAEPTRRVRPVHKRKRKLRPKVILGVLLAAILTGLLPLVVLAQSVNPTYDWYKDASGDVYTLSDRSDFIGFIELVNGTADVNGTGELALAENFEGKTVKLDSSINLLNQVIKPAGGQKNLTFEGTFDGQGNTIDNFVIDATAGTKNIGLIGKAGANSVIQNVTIGASSKIDINLEGANNSNAVQNIGLLVGESEGSIVNCTNSGSVSISHDLNQTAEISCPIQNVGGIAGICYKNIENNTNNGAITIQETGNVFTPSPDSGLSQQRVLVVNVGGVVGNAGTLDTILDSDTPEVSGTVTNCTNSGKIDITTPSDAGVDRFGNPIFAQSANVGGVAGYSKSNIDSCVNNAYIRTDNGTTVGGVVGSLRSCTAIDPNSGNFTSESADDGSEGNELLLSRCQNNGDVYGRDCIGGVVGATGTYTSVKGSLNNAGTIVMANRPNKPFPAGVVARSYGDVAYCANLGDVVAGSWKNEDSREFKVSAGYYASGIVGHTVYYTQPDENGAQKRATPLPEVYSCYNAGSVYSTDNMRQRSLVGDNNGYVHDCVSEQGKVYKDKLIYGIYPGDNEAVGTAERVFTVTHDQIIGNSNLTEESIVGGFGIEQVEGKTIFEIFNQFGDQDGWDTYWVKSDGTVNGGYPVLNHQVTWDLTDISAAAVTLKKNAEYTGLASVPKAHVVMPDNTVLTQDVDFKVIPQENATEITAEGETPYVAMIQGIGNYSGQGNQSFNYGIDAGDIDNCTVLSEKSPFNWEAQVPKPEDFTIKNLAGGVVDPSEYSVELDPKSENLTDGQAIDAGAYDVIITASNSEGSHFKGTTHAVWRIEPVRILTTLDPETQAQNAQPLKIKYLGQELDWESTIEMNASQTQEPSHEFQYTGYPIKPDVTKVSYLGRDLVEGRDFQVLYGESSIMIGTPPAEPGAENVGVKGGEGYGYIIIRNIYGSNFTNYDIMKFKIVDSGEKADLANAEIKNDQDVIYEGEHEYKPIEVWYGGSKLTEGVDYTISYANNTALGEASYTVQAVEGSKLTGTKTGTFNIVEGIPYEFTFDFNDDGTATVTGVKYFGNLDKFDMEIPATVDKDGTTYTVTKIANNAFGGTTETLFVTSPENESKDKIRSVVIPSTVETIGNAAFASYKANGNALEEVIFADIEHSKLKLIDSNAFANSTNISEFTFPASLEKINRNSFDMQKSSEEVPSKLNKIVFLSEDESKPSYNAGENTFSFGKVGKFINEVKVYGNAKNDGTPLSKGVAEFVKVNSETHSNQYIDGRVGKNFKFYPLNQLESVSVTFNINDAQGDTPTLKEPIVKGSIIALPSADGFSKENAEFNGWKCSADNKTYQAGDFYKVTNDSTVFTAQWNATAHVVTFDSKGGSQVASQTVKVGENATKPDNPTRDGYKFMGWYTSDDGGDTLSNTEFNFAETSINSDVTLYAKWVELTPLQVTLSGSDSANFGYSLGDLSLTATVTTDEGAIAESYQWYKTNANQTSSEVISGANALTYDIPSGLNAGTYYYYIKVTGKDANGKVETATSNVARVEVLKNDNSISFDKPVTIKTSSNSVNVSNATPQFAGEVVYGISDRNTVPTKWQDSASFTGLAENTSYWIFAKVKETQNYNEATSAPVEARTKTKGTLENPVLSSIEYNPAKTLADVALPDNWSWTNTAIVPEVDNNGFEAIYSIPAGDEADYSNVEGYDSSTRTVKRTLTLPVEKANPAISKLNASAITYGQSLEASELSSSSDIEGTFTWVDPSIKPDVSDSENTSFNVIFNPSEEFEKNYKSVELTTKLQVLPRTLQKDDVEISVLDQTYTGDPLKPELEISLGGVPLAAGVDYEVSYSNNIDPGEGEFTVTFKGNYIGGVSGNFNISKNIKVVVDNTSDKDIQVKGLKSLAQLVANANPQAKSIIVTLELSPEDANSVDAQAIKNKAGTFMFDKFYSVKLLQTVDGVTTDIGDSNDHLIEVSYPFDFAGKKYIQVFVKHGDTVEILTEEPNKFGEYVSFDKANNRVNIYSKRYSVFAIGYVLKDQSSSTDIPHKDNVDGVNNTKRTSGKLGAPAQASKAHDGKKVIPKTSDKSLAPLYVLSALGITALSFSYVLHRRLGDR